MSKHRCGWARSDLMIAYHDLEWGVPQHDDRVLFEFLILEGAQAGLSWETILKKRENYRKAFARFDPRKVAKFTASDEKPLLFNVEEDPYERIDRAAEQGAKVTELKAAIDAFKESVAKEKTFWD